ncbi:L-seryl-tRNA(Sec) selenium transferase [Clostridium sp. D2Q-11]|uniref:L-seryl-tRNA(Sec) selenium transferase n=1 Tax=Anaeromonas frigoriresistens TaxID=2683708 RepID=A0A942UVF4_9FIRM|nr:L-seryl-tRNA(Sec) selenium transferase [Anaeromonas frigoriresistens]MBS4537151.1 L-seryl-tRNA(Sec) selenium transferase [Anaeromonas frigoriresistens]
MENKNILFRSLPKVDEILQKEKIEEALNYIPRDIVLESIREVIEDIRKNIQSSTITKASIEERIQRIDYEIIEKAKMKIQPKLRKVINGTGTIIHTNLGRSLISREIMERVVEIASEYSNLEYDLEEGRRGSRYSHIEDIICRITGAEAALVVNNNASAVMLILSTLAKNKEVIVSRGELVEIGGSFRVPEVMEQSGGKLVDVGTTNKTHLWDYEKAIGEDTSVLLKVHTSNYRIVGFTESVSIEELVKLGNQRGIPVVEDIGSGVLIDLSKYGLSYEPTVQESINRGVDIVSFSGDKLLGGPQAGIIVGKKDLIDKMKRNQLTRAIRVDKMTIAALELILREYLDEDKAIRNIPTLRMLTIQLEEIGIKAEKLYNLIIKNVDKLSVEIVDDFSQVGGGSLPLEQIPTKVLSIKSEDFSVNLLEESLRTFRTPIITRINNNNLLIDLRTVEEKDFDIIVEGIIWAINNCRSV